MRRRDELAAYNERLKLGATTSNALGLAVIAVGVLRPLIDDAIASNWGIAIYIVIGIALHASAQYIVSQVEIDE